MTNFCAVRLVSDPKSYLSWVKFFAGKERKGNLGDEKNKVLREKQCLPTVYLQLGHLGVLQQLTEAYSKMYWQFVEKGLLKRKDYKLVIMRLDFSFLHPSLETFK